MGGRSAAVRQVGKDHGHVSRGWPPPRPCPARKSWPIPPLRFARRLCQASPVTPSAAEQRRAALLAAPILPTLLKLAAPTVTVLVAQTAVNIAEAYYVGFLGTDALAGAALVFPIFMLMTMMSNGGFGSGVASSVARAVGAGVATTPRRRCFMPSCSPSSPAACSRSA
jgi:hypothetical protein